MSATENSNSPVLIGSVFCPAGELQRGVRCLLRAAALLTSHREYLSDSVLGKSLRETRMGLIALRVLFEGGLAEGEE